MPFFTLEVFDNQSECIATYEISTLSFSTI